MKEYEIQRHAYCPTTNGMNVITERVECTSYEIELGWIIFIKHGEKILAIKECEVILIRLIEQN